MYFGQGIITFLGEWNFNWCEKKKKNVDWYTVQRFNITPVYKYINNFKFENLFITMKYIFQIPICYVALT